MVDTNSSPEALAYKFKTWRGNRRFVRHPKSLWDEIR